MPRLFDLKCRGRTSHTLPRPRAAASRRPLATAFGGDLRSGHNFGLAFGEGDTRASATLAYRLGAFHTALAPDFIGSLRSADSRVLL